jgi:mannosyl-oligosaccharide alpha-1,2-mannosidase
MKKKDGIYYNYVNPQNGTWCSSHAGLAGLGDSFYEYLLKYWLYKDRKDARILKMYLSAMEAVRNKLVAKSSGGLTYLDEYVGSFLAHKMGHLACFTGGLFALTAIYVDELAADERYVFRSLATEITHTCHESYTRTATRIGPESFSFKNGAEAEPLDSYYILRPEVIEAYFYMWRMTKDEKYRDWAWDAAEAIERHCRTDSGYSGLKDVRFVNSVKDDVQQSFFFAETLKYLFLIFSDDDVLPLDKFVLNTEAHPFLIPKS